MADLQRIQFKRTSTAGRKPDANILTPGELAINLADRELYTKDDSNNVITLGQFRGELPTDANLDNYGPTGKFTGIWSKATSTNAQPTHKFPEENAVGVLEVFAAGQFAGTQRYTTRYGNVFIRSLSAKWNGVDGPWGVWRNIQSGTRPLSTTIDLNDLGGAEHFGLWRNSSNTIATFDRNFPEEGSSAQGLLEVYEGGNYSRTQRYTTRFGVVYTRCLAAAWDATAPKWGPWQQVGNVTPATFYDGNLNDFKTPGLYNILGTDAVINCPTGEGLPPVIVGLLEVKQRASGVAIFQKFTTAGTGATTRGRIFERAYTGGAWGAWNEVYTSYSLPITLGMGGVKAQLTELDWQTFDFVPGGMYSVPLNKVKNMPANMDWGTIDGNLIMLSVGPSEHTGTGRTVQVWRGTVSQANYRYFVVRVAGNPGNRTNTVRRVVVEDGSHTWTAQQNFRGLLNITADVNLGANKKISLAAGSYIQAPASGSGSNTYANQNITIAPLYQAIDDSNKNQFAPIVKQKNTVSNITFATGMAVGTSEYKIIAQGDLSANGKADELKQWTFMPSGYFKSPGRVYVGDAFLNTDGNIAGSIWKKYNNATNLEAALNTRVGKGGDVMTGRLTINTNSDAVVVNCEENESCYIKGQKAGVNNWYVGSGGADNTASFYSFATTAGISLNNVGDIDFNVKNQSTAMSLNFYRLWLNGRQWVATQGHGYDSQWQTEAPFFVDFGESVRKDSYMPIIKGRSQLVNEGYATKADFGIIRTGGNATWGNAVIRVGSAEGSGGNHPNAIFVFQANGDFVAPAGLRAAVNLGVGTIPVWGGPSIAIGDNDTGLMHGGDGRINLVANGQHIASWGVFHQEHPGLWSVGAGLWTEVDKAIISHGHLIQANDNYSTYVRDIYIRSDIRVKKDLVKFENASKTLSKINGYMYLQKRGLNEDGSERWEPNAGLIAQEVQAILPELVEGDPVGENLLRLNYNGVIGLTTAAINEHTEEISLLKEENKLLRDRLAAIEAKLFG